MSGYAPRCRLDLTVNILTNHAVQKRKITVFGGEQYRPNLHIKDMVRLYEMLLELPKEKIAGETFNAGYRKMKVIEIAGVVKRGVEEEFPDLVPIEIERIESDDNRSYRGEREKANLLCWHLTCEFFTRLKNGLGSSSRTGIPATIGLSILNKRPRRCRSRHGLATSLFE